MPEPPYRPRRARPDPGGLTERNAPRRAAPDPVPAAPAGKPAGGAPAAPKPPPGFSPYPGGVPPLPSQWGPGPDAAPEFGLPDHGRSHAPRATSGRRSRRPGRGGRRTPFWLTVVGVLAVAVLAGVCAAGGYIMFTHPDATGTAAGSPPAQPKPRDISSRQADPQPLSEAELFPAPTLSSGYQVLKTQAADCTAAAVGEPGKVLAIAGCAQMVRATLVSADKTYVVTAGLLNLATQDGAQQANDALRTAVGAQKGRFTGFAAGGVSDIFAKAPTQLGWDVRGHFLGYCVVARADGKPLDGTDPAANKVIDDLVEKYLLGLVVQARVSPSPPSPTASASAQPSRT